MPFIQHELTDEIRWVDEAWEVAAFQTYFKATTSETGEVGLYEYRYSNGERIGDRNSRNTAQPEAS